MKKSEITFCSFNNLPLYAHKGWQLITISTTIDFHDIVDEEGAFSRVLKLSFSDYSPADSYNIKNYLPDAKLFTLDDANKILDFVFKNRYHTFKLLIQCEAGISRSTAIAAFLTRICSNSDDSEFFSKYNITPNLYIYSKLIEAYSNKYKRFDRNEIRVN